MGPLVAALYVHRDGVYYNLPDVDPWDEERDARTYPGPYSVIAHPPCGPWGAMAPVNQARYGHPVGDDGGCFASALASVRAWGGVLEHPAGSRAWAAFGLTRPRKGGGWVPAGDGAWTTEVHQRNYGHRAMKRTWLLYVGDAPPAPLDWSPPAPATAWISTDRPRAELRAMGIEQLSKREAAATPPAFRDVLLALARGAR
jgi:hypothetical protein